MPALLMKEIDKIKKHVLSLGTVVEEQVQLAVKSLKERDVDLAEEVIQRDLKVDQMEVDLEEDCLKILALHQPVAIDLRFLIAVLKINNDLERIGDLAVNVCERSKYLSQHPRLDITLDFTGMSEKVKKMLKLSLDSLVNLDAVLASSVCEMDDDVDQINREMYIKVQEAIRKHPERLEQLIHVLSVSRHLERIADQTTNIAEDVIYMVEGKIVRHCTEDYVASLDIK